jgi:serine/threonine-protein kinase ATR
MFMSVMKSQKRERSLRGQKVVLMLQVGLFHRYLQTYSDRQTNPNHAGAYELAEQCIAMSTAFLDLCDHPVTDFEPLSVDKNFPQLRRLVPANLIVPLQESLVATLPPVSGDDVTHRPFPQPTPTIQGSLQ